MIQSNIDHNIVPKMFADFGHLAAVSDKIPGVFYLFVCIKPHSFRFERVGKKWKGVEGGGKLFAREPKSRTRVKLDAG